ncbi:EboA domain-containing protein [Amycolatopsis sp. BJA-103]|uniref:EboA domain-containing protein n=1 Tax=unclassified Amycolatopsis TaxID=2618356 RepID=UPI000C777DD4|nr:EboA domain-containing protein [Amycolatopsis sp. BJA-103]AUI63917.1 sugar phosphate isomerase [Amycolatopsis sp. BJA-103]PNE15945.1 sugar phosphate isomerase [Amycolatopsis sp. BJA-103]
MSFSLGYGTNGFSNHRLDDALAVIADLGYTGVALTLDHDHLDPFADDLARQVDHVASRLSALGLNRVVIETGARYLLDPWRKHSPTLLSDDPALRIDFLAKALQIAGDLGADCVSFWSGVSTMDNGVAWSRLREGVAAVLEHAARLNVRLAMEPEPGHLVQHLGQVLDLRKELGEPELFGVTLDVGHCVAVEPVDAAECVRLAGPLLWNVQLDDMLPKVHEHLEFGDGQLDLPATLAALSEIGYTGLAAVELPRHSHAAPDTARRAFEALTAALPEDTWLTKAESRIREKPSVIGSLFPAVGREVGRTALQPETDPQGLVHGTVDDAARSRLIGVLSRQLPPVDLAVELGELYRYGDDAERRGVLRGLNKLVQDGSLDEKVSGAGQLLVADALRANDIRLVAAAMGAFAARHLEPHTWRHGVLKCVFVGVPLAAVAELETRADDELRRMLADFADERRAAGRDVPADALSLLKEGH